ncbi:hypothetical protein B9Z55_003331 [Caenorhabditis nigoni]|uniref:Uncharacterized protein n=1 Tax=Caenorhabditis nigoni TaxID=1611254 RepID=A0A2G5VPS3_9PELO|nr:hypothetical protein B9Z55_003331 [Caenorhabditis nigoni]
MASETESSRSGRIVQRNSSNSGHYRTNNTTTHLYGALSAKRDEERVCPRRVRVCPSARECVCVRDAECKAREFE